jgi:hypothetical protein
MPPGPGLYTQRVSAADHPINCDLGPKNDYVLNFCGVQRFLRLLLWLGRVVSPVAHAHRVRVTAVACVAGYLLIPHGEDAGAGKI